MQPFVRKCQIKELLVTWSRTQTNDVNHDFCSGYTIFAALCLKSFHNKKLRKRTSIYHNVSDAKIQNSRKTSARQVKMCRGSWQIPHRTPNKQKQAKTGQNRCPLSLNTGRGRPVFFEGFFP